MAKISGSTVITYADLYTSTSQRPSGISLGQLVWGQDGKAFRYVLAGETLVVGDLCQGSVIDTQFDDMTCPITAVGSTVVSITNGTTAVTAHQFEGGTLSVSVTPGLGEEYTIIAHGTALSGAALSLTLDRPLRTAWTTSTKVTLRRSPYSGVIKTPQTTLSASVVGVAMYPVASGEYGWIQSHGVCSVLSDGTSIIAGSAVAAPSGTAAGEMTLLVAGLPQVGYAMRAAATGKCIPVFLKID